MREKGLLKISELSKASGAPASTIRYYIHERILPPPVKTGKTRGYYTREHLEGIALIRRKQMDEKKTLREIRDEMPQEFADINSTSEADMTVGKRHEIISAAVELFFQKGYSETSIADIASRVRMSKETFYLHFRNKEELFMDCADRIFHDMYNNVWQEIREEKDMMKRIWKRSHAFFDSYPQWVVMMDLVRSLSVGENPAFKEKLTQLLKQMINPIIREIDQLKREGRIRKDIDSAVAGYVLMGMSEYSAYLVNRGVYSRKKIVDYLDSILKQGLLYKT